MSNPKVLIAIPTYNKPEGLEEQINNCLYQSYENVQIIVRDNCSENPKVKEILENYKYNYPDKFDYVINPYNVGADRNFNLCLNDIPEDIEYFMWAADDDLLDRNFVRDAVRMFIGEDNMILIYPLAVYNKKYTEDFGLINSSPRKRLLKYISNVEKNPLIFGLIKLSAIKPRHKPFSEEIGGDWSLIGRLCLLGEIWCLSSRIYLILGTEGGSSSKKKMIQTYKLKGLRKIFFELYMSWTVSKNIFNGLDYKPIPKYTLIIQCFIIYSFRLLLKFIKKIIKKKKL